ncbi:MucR family transcriptional regulator [Methylorubrum extorquens]|uniref:MucR family transcriptional regulator n=1 Tax=Methylorubrum extorquens TaxID=408 RepID=UPI001EE5AE84|nr:MucR family transcriptional regulator [Methylorubrum extorquens]MCG5248931.1 MucR family transcriptional regulator [Methylorubrum extorquens]
MSGDTSGTAPDCNPITLAADIVFAYVGKNVLPARELPGLIVSVHAAFAGLSRTPAAIDAADLDIGKPTIAEIRKSITPDGLISFIDGKSYKTLKRHLRRHGLDAHSYRARYGLPSNYPTTAPNYSAQRSAVAKGFGFGQKRAD